VSHTMKGPRSRASASLLLVIVALSGCGKSLSRTSHSDAHSAATAVSDLGASGLSTENTTRLGGSSPVLDAAAVARTVHPGLTPKTRPQAVVLVDERSWPAALAASVLSAAPLNAPLLYTEGESLPDPSAQALTAMRPLGSSTLGGAQVIEVADSAAPKGYVAHLLPAGEPAVLAAGIEQIAAKLQGAPPRRVIIVASNGPAALSMPAAGLAAESGAPILFVDTNTIPVATSTLLASLKQPTIYVVGSSLAVSQTVADDLGRYGLVRRINGAGPASNAIAVAQFSEGSFGWGVQEPGHGLVFLNASRPLDAPAAASLSASGDYGPLLLLEHATQIPAELATYLHNIQPGYTSEPQYRPVRGVYNHGWLIGDEQAISATIQAELDTRLQITQRSTPPTEAASASQTSSDQEAEQ
jgi:putative cell wall-binding protein